jgi:hypothetical protein
MVVFTGGDLRIKAEGREEEEEGNYLTTEFTDYTD